MEFPVLFAGQLLAASELECTRLGSFIAIIMHNYDGLLTLACVCTGVCAFGGS